MNRKMVRKKGGGGGGGREGKALVRSGGGEGESVEKGSEEEDGQNRAFDSRQEQAARGELDRKRKCQRDKGGHRQKKMVLSSKNTGGKGRMMILGG